MVADTWDMHSREDVEECTVLPVQSRTSETCAWSWRTARGARLTMGLVVWASKPPIAMDAGFV